MVLEMTFAPDPLFRPLYGFYLGRVLPRLARLFARNGATYFYLGDSIRHFPAPPVLASLMRQAGLQSVSWHRLTFGAAYLHVGRTPGGN
jgi:demethylmenaquinone methyltransferase/2-methoxy-6-polyprenyl-1,4-benzoquinol methylase